MRRFDPCFSFYSYVAFRLDESHKLSAAATCGVGGENIGGPIFRLLT